ncbi:HAD family hydrolase [Paenibacillus humicola]|uniref:HAD family hydrolase n=1 Tax=Paenibacillus humicola TaxID=3110540 RepID=UPI00237C2FD8|nr:HAD family hydrolase [Paenibacillus humicola]
MKPVKAVFFDLYETLVTEFADGKRLSNRKTDYAALLGLPNEAFKREWAARQQRRMTGHFPDYYAVIADIARERGLDVDPANVERLYRDRCAEKELPFRRVRPDIPAMLGRLREEGMKLGLISNCTEEEVRGWSGSPLAALFDDALFSYEIGMAKPDRAIYLLGCERLSVLPEESIFVGDGGSGELEGARAAGMRPLHAFWYNTYVQSDAKKIGRPEELVRELTGKAQDGDRSDEN